MRNILPAVSGLLFTLAAAVDANAGRVVVSHDEWTTSNFGFSAAGGTNAQRYTQNLANFLKIGGGSGNFLIYSNNFGLTESSFLSTLTAAGHSTTINTAIPFTLAALSAFDAIMLAGDGFSKNDTVLRDYVNSGHSVYIEAGTGAGGAVAEAARWNGFLSNFGLAFDSTYNGCCGNDVVTGTHPILTGVVQLYSNNGNTVTLLGGIPNAQIIEFSAGGLGLLGVFNDVAAPVPEPSTWLLAAASLAFLAVRRPR